MVEFKRGEAERGAAFVDFEHDGVEYKKFLHKEFSFGGVRKSIN